MFIFFVNNNRNFKKLKKMQSLFSNKAIFFLFLFKMISSKKNSRKNYSDSSYSFLILMIILSIVILIIILLIIYICFFQKYKNKNIDKTLFEKKKKIYLFQNIITPLKYNDEYEKFGNQCSICLEKYGEKKKICLTECNHIFHFKCLRKFILESKFSLCPLCKFDLVKNLKEKNINFNNIIINELSLDDEEEENPENNNINSYSNSNNSNNKNNSYNNIRILYNDNEIDDSVRENNSNILLKERKKQKLILLNDDNSMKRFRGNLMSEDINRYKPNKINFSKNHESYIIHNTEVI